MSEETILKKEAVKIVKKRFKELLKPLGFQTYPHSTTRFMRVREDFIDEVRLDTWGSHLDAAYYIYLRTAPFAWLHCDRGRLWRTTKEHISTHLFWECKMPTNGGSWYYKTEHFEAVWQDIAYVLQNHILPQMEDMTEEVFVSRLLERSMSDSDFFLAHQTVSLEYLYYPGTPEAAIYGVALWRLGKYEEGAVYLTYARQKYHDWLKTYEQELDDSHFYLCHIRTTELLDELMSLWENRPENWQVLAQERISRIKEDWIEYLL